MVFPSFLYLTLLCAVGVALSSADTATTSSSWPANLQTTWKCETPAPVSFSSNDAIVYKTNSPLTINVSRSGPGQLCNNGSLVTARSTLRVSTTRLFGGVLGDKNVYIGAEVRYFWTNSLLEWFGANIDEKSTQLAAVIVFYNSLYKSLEDAYKYRDGTAILRFKISVQGHIPNPDFVDLIEALKKITIAGKCTPITAAQVEIPIFNTTDIKLYYAYPGSNYEQFEPEPKQSYGATEIVFPTNEGNWMSIEQYYQFTKLKNKFGSPVDSSITSYDKGCRTIVESYGFVTNIQP